MTDKTAGPATMSANVKVARDVTLGLMRHYNIANGDFLYSEISKVQASAYLANEVASETIENAAKIAGRAIDALGINAGSHDRGWAAVRALKLAGLLAFASPSPIPSEAGMADKDAMLKRMSVALLKVRPLGGSELFTKFDGDYIADPEYCGKIIEQMRDELHEARCDIVRQQKASQPPHRQPLDGASRKRRKRSRTLLPRLHRERSDDV